MELVSNNQSDWWERDVHGIPDERRVYVSCAFIARVRTIFITFATELSKKKKKTYISLRDVLTTGSCTSGPSTLYAYNIVADNNIYSLRKKIRFVLWRCVQLFLFVAGTTSKAQRARPRPERLGY